jgi:hypothetical protein
MGEILDLHPRLRVLIEPFAENFHTWERDNKNYLEQICRCRLTGYAVNRDFH